MSEDENNVVSFGEKAAKIKVASAITKQKKQDVEKIVTEKITSYYEDELNRTGMDRTIAALLPTVMRALDGLVVGQNIENEGGGGDVSVKYQKVDIKEPETLEFVTDEQWKSIIKKSIEQRAEMYSSKPKGDRAIARQGAYSRT